MAFVFMFISATLSKTTAFNNSGGNNAGVKFDASRVSSIYGKSNTVQPPAIKYYFYIVVGTVTKTDIEVNIDNIATDLNNKVDKNAGNLSSGDVTNWIGKLGIADYVKQHMKFKVRVKTGEQLVTGTYLQIYLTASDLGLADNEFIFYAYSSQKNESNQYSNNALPQSVIDYVGEDGKSIKFGFVRQSNDGTMRCLWSVVIARIEFV